MFYSKEGKKSISKMKPIRLWAVLLVPVVAFTLGAGAPEAWAGSKVPFAEQEIFFEFNSTDLDLGIHIFFDAVGWVEVEVRGEDGEEIFEVENDENLKKLGSTEVFTESAEPPLVEDPDTATEEEILAAIAAFQSRFPEGRYKFRGRTIDGRRLRGRAFLSHALPAAPAIDDPLGLPISSSTPYIISWNQLAEGPTIVSYEVVAEMVIDGRTFVNTATLPGNSPTMYTVSPDFIQAALDAGDDLEEFKVEVIARAENNNKTIAEKEVELD